MERSRVESGTFQSDALHHHDTHYRPSPLDSAWPHRIVILVWRKGNINIAVSCYSIVYHYNVAQWYE